MSDVCLPPHVQKAVLGRLLVYKALDLHHAELDAAGHGLLWSDIRNKLEGSTARQLRYARDDQSVWAYLGELAAELRTAPLPFPSDDAKAACTPLLEQIDSLVREACELQRDLLLDAFRLAKELASAAYRQHDQRVPAEMFERISVSLDHQAGPLRHGLPIHLTASTELRDENLPQAAVVSVVIIPEALDERTAFALPYVLLHECLCHALQGPWKHRRVQADANSRFAEGWMDVAAYRLHQSVDPEVHRVPTIGLMTAPRLMAQMEAASDVHKARHSRNEIDRAWSHRVIGRDAAERMFDLIGRLPESKGDAAKPFMHLSLALNVSMIDNYQRDRFVSIVHKLTLFPSHQHRLVPFVRDYLGDHNMQGLVDAVLKLAT
jgi:hypothetical protein